MPSPICLTYDLVALQLKDITCHKSWVWKVEAPLPLPVVGNWVHLHVHLVGSFLPSLRPVTHGRWPLLGAPSLLYKQYDYIDVRVVQSAMHRPRYTASQHDRTNSPGRSRRYTVSSVTNPRRDTRTSVSVKDLRQLNVDSFIEGNLLSGEGARGSWIGHLPRAAPSLEPQMAFCLAYLIGFLADIGSS